MDTDDQSQHRLPHEEGYGSPTAEEEMPPAEQQEQVRHHGNDNADQDGPDGQSDQNRADGQSNDAEQPTGNAPVESEGKAPAEAPSTDAEIDEANSDDSSPRESFSSESDEEGSGLADE